MKADALFWTGSFDSAATLYREYLSKEKGDSPLHLAVQQSLAFTLESKKEFPAAAKEYEELATTAPDRSSAADFLMSAARSYRNANQPDKARALYEKVSNEYKDTTFGRDAEVELGEILAAQP
jgi:TolA-binding protein